MTREITRGKFFNHGGTRMDTDWENSGEGREKAAVLVLRVLR
jgi:hypothetical protein